MSFGGMLIFIAGSFVLLFGILLVIDTINRKKTAKQQ